jgi:hypothetical protein
MLSPKYERTSENLATQVQQVIALTIIHPCKPSDFVTGFLHFWAKYVKGFNHEFHCQKALRGRLSSCIKTKTTPLNTRLILAECENYDSIYICGVADGRVSARGANNIHLPLELQPGNEVVHATYNGYLLHIENAAILPTPELPAGWCGLSDAYTRCRNFRFGVHRFGYPPASDSRDALRCSRSRDQIGERGQACLFGWPLDPQLDSTTPHQRQRS